MQSITPKEAFEAIDRIISEVRFTRAEQNYVNQCLQVIQQLLPKSLDEDSNQSE